jgi:hypothetical protein
MQWVAVEWLTGNIVCDLPGIVLSGPLATTIGQVESTQMSLFLDDNTNPSWLTGTTPGGSALVAYTGTNTAPTIVWGGIVTQRVREPGSPVVQLALSTPEAYLDGCQVGTYTASNLNQDTVLQGLMAFAMGTNRPNWTLTHVAPSTQTQTVKYSPSDQTSVYAALQALSAVQGGPEWVAGWTWNVAAGTITPTMTYGSRIGQPVNAGAQPNVTIESADLMAGSAFSEDYSPGMGANVVTAFGSASANATSSDVPYATAQEVDLKGRPLWTYIYSPNQTVTDVNTLATYASQAVALMQDGAQPLTMTIANDLIGKQFGVDWQLGDDIGWVIDGPAFPEPVSGVSRCVSYQADLSTITPILKGASLS